MKNTTSTAILAIGTEITHGQILNSNAQILSKSLMDLGFRVGLHLSCPDSLEPMKRCLRFALQEADLVVLTGGLGPTTDDLTRDLLAAELGLPLEISSDAKERIEAKLTSRKIKLTPGHLRQCQFPKGADILENPVGTADGFLIETEGKTLIALPGPPKELAAIWQRSLIEILKKKHPGLDREAVFSWDILGIPESQVAELIETKAGDLTPCQAGYRVHLPFVEFKLVFPESLRNQALDVARRVEHILGPIAPLKNGETSLSRLRHAIEASAKTSVRIIDQLESDYLFNQLSKEQFYPLLLKAGISLYFEGLKPCRLGFQKKTGPVQIELGVRPLPICNKLRSYSTGGNLEQPFVSWAEAWVRVCKGEASWVKKESWPSAFVTQNLSDRSALYFAERALLFWSQALQQMT